MILSNRPVVILSALNGLMAVGFGAFAAHGLDDAHARELIRTGALYQLVHAAAPLAMAAHSRAGALLAGLGGLLFGASLYGLALGAASVVGAVTPVGGALMLAGWAVLLVTAFRTTVSPETKTP